MKNVKPIYFIAFCFLASCSGDNKIDLIKNGIINDYDKVKPVGEAFDKWSNCEKTEWVLLSKSDNYAEVKYACSVKNIDKIISKLKENQEALLENRKLEIRSLERDIKNAIGSLKFASCQNEFFIEKMNAGYIFKGEDSLFTENELKESVGKYNELFNERLGVLDTEKNLDEKELLSFEKKLSEIYEKIQYQFSYTREDDTLLSNSTYENDKLSLAGDKNDNNPKHKEIVSKLLDCSKKIEFSENYNRPIIMDERYLGRGSFSNLFDMQKKLSEYTKNRDFNSLKKIEFVVVFGVNDKKFEIKKSHADVLIGQESKAINYTSHEAGKSIYGNVVFSEENVQDSDFRELAKMF